MNELRRTEKTREWVQRALDIATETLRETITIEIVNGMGADDLPIYDEHLTDHIYEVATKAVIDAWLYANTERSLSADLDTMGRPWHCRCGEGLTYPPDAALQLQQELKQLIDYRPIIPVEIKPH
jgi:hypothetical protein